MPPIAGLNFQRGEALLTLGKVREAEAALREEVAAFPGNRQAWANLSVVIGAQGRRDEARATLREALGRNRDRKMFEKAIEALSAMGDEQGITELRSQFGGKL
jgi:Flp pilus assembly protein TadD